MLKITNCYKNIMTRQEWTCTAVATDLPSFVILLQKQRILTHAFLCKVCIICPWNKSLFDDIIFPREG